MAHWTILIVLSLLCGACADTQTLSEKDRSKLDQALLKLLTEPDAPDTPFDVTRRADGTKEYGVIVRSAEADDLRSKGIHVVSVFGDVVTVRATRDELRALVSLPSVRAMEAGSRNVLH
jgi:hypothetical protein